MLIKRWAVFTLSLLLLLSLFACNSGKKPQESLSESGALSEKDSETGIESDTETEDPLKESPETNVYEPDTWDGTVAESFESGSGTQDDPYKIASAEQFAFLSKSVNEGASYIDKYILLLCDLDLNHLEWTPIGNGTLSFSGVFDGGNHSILNLQISNGMHFVTDNSYREIAEYTTGLFGSCIDAVIKNLTIDTAVITVQNTVDRYVIMAGILVGTMRSESAAEISDITITNASIVCNFEQEKSATSLRIGGVVGYVYGSASSSYTITNVNAEVNTSIANGHGNYNHIGGIIGAVSTNNLCNARDCASYLSVEVDTENCYMQHNYFGAFGAVSTRNNTVSIHSIFSKVTTNKIYDISHGYVAYKANAIIGETTHGKQTDGTVIGGYDFKNLFGFVEQICTSTGETAKSMQLYELPSHTLFTETNCQGCEQLPTNHGFDAVVWDLSDLSAPKILNG